MLVKAGDDIEVDAPLVTLETDKASMDVPAAAAGRIAEVLLKRGDKVSKGSVIARVETDSRPVRPRARRQSPTPALRGRRRPAAKSPPHLLRHRRCEAGVGRSTRYGCPCRT